MSSTTSCPSKTKPKAKSYLRPTNVFVRIRPPAESGGHADDADGGGAVAKTLEGWSDSTVTLGTQYMFSKGSAEYAFPRRVLGPGATQRDAFDAMEVRDLVRQFTNFGGRNVMMFAYGQTGSGKTHTMLGTDKSLEVSNDSMEDRLEGWGLFPRVYHAAEREMLSSGQPYVLSASAIEFYSGGCWDLLEPGRSVWIDADTHRPVGETSREMRGADDLLHYLADVQRNRTTRGTRMNEANGLHGGSSRSHAALTLSLRRRNHEDEYCETCFTMIDLAGAERPTKTGEKRFTSGDMLVYMMSKGQELPTGAQAYLINFELSAIASEVLRATEAHRRGVPYAPPRQLVTEVTKFIGGCFDGTCIASMCLCLSPANVNGWETWFSLQYGSSVSQLRVPVRRQEPVQISTAHRRAKKEARSAAQELAKAPTNKFYEIRRLRAIDAQQRLSHLKRIVTLTTEE